MEGLLIRETLEMIKMFESYLEKQEPMLETELSSYFSKLPSVISVLDRIRTEESMDIIKKLEESKIIFSEMINRDKDIPVMNEEGVNQDFIIDRCLNISLSIFALILTFYLGKSYIIK